MKIALLTTVNSHKAGGLYNSVRNLGLSLFHKGVDLEFFSYDDEYSKNDLVAYENLPMIKYHRTKLPYLKELGYSRDLNRILEEHAPNIIHSQGIWMYNSYATHVYQKRKGAKTIITPRGMLDPWAIRTSRWKKKIVKILFENANLHDANCIQALNHSEYESIRKFGLRTPVAIIPNGINLPDNVVYDRGKEKKVALFVGRIHPKKGISELLDGLHIVKKRTPNVLNKWEVRIAGWDQLGHTDYLKRKCRELGLDYNVSFIGPILGDEKEREHLNADAFILPSFSEGLPMSVLEAWSYRLPVVMTDQCNLPDGFEKNAAIRITTEVESIAEGLQLLFTMSDEERNFVGGNGYNLVKYHYTWDGIADRTIQLYKWLLEGGDVPSFVKIE